MLNWSQNRTELCQQDSQVNKYSIHYTAVISMADETYWQHKFKLKEHA